MTHVGTSPTLPPSRRLDIAYEIDAHQGGHGVAFWKLSSGQGSCSLMKSNEPGMAYHLCLSLTEGTPHESAPRASCYLTCDGIYVRVSGASLLDPKTSAPLEALIDQALQTGQKASPDPSVALFSSLNLSGSVSNELSRQRERYRTAGALSVSHLQAIEQVLRGVTLSPLNASLDSLDYEDRLTFEPIGAIGGCYRFEVGDVAVEMLLVKNERDSLSTTIQVSIFPLVDDFEGEPPPYELEGVRLSLCSKTHSHRFTVYRDDDRPCGTVLEVRVKESGACSLVLSVEEPHLKALVSDSQLAAQAVLELEKAMGPSQAGIVSNRSQAWRALVARSTEDEGGFDLLVFKDALVYLCKLSPDAEHTASILSGEPASIGDFLRPLLSASMFVCDPDTRRSETIRTLLESANKSAVEDLLSEGLLSLAAHDTSPGEVPERLSMKGTDPLTPQALEALQRLLAEPIVGTASQAETRREVGQYLLKLEFCEDPASEGRGELRLRFLKRTSGEDRPLYLDHLSLHARELRGEQQFCLGTRGEKIGEIQFSELRPGIRYLIEPLTPPT